MTTALSACSCEREAGAPEQWRPCPGDDRYQVSDRGRVRNAATGHVLRPQGRRYGYLKVHLGRHRQASVHRLVCEAFHGPPPLSTDHADHLDFQVTHNCASNLRWLSAPLNIGRQVRWGQRGWERVGDEDAPEGYVELTDDERAALDAELAAQGW